MQIMRPMQLFRIEDHEACAAGFFERALSRAKSRLGIRQMQDHIGRNRALTQTPQESLFLCLQLTNKM